MSRIERDDLLTALYKATSKGDLLSQFDKNLSSINLVFRERDEKITNDRRYSFLLEQVILFSHAIIFNQSVQNATNWRGDFLSKAKKNKDIKLSSEEIEKAFSFFHNPLAWDFLSNDEKIKRTKESIEKNPTKRLKNQLQKLEKNNPSNNQNKDSSAVSNSCIAKDEINRLKAQLDNKTYELAKGQKEEDKIIFIKVALVALSTGARLKDIMEDLTVSTKKGVIYFDDGISSKEGVILELDTKTVQSYLKAIRSHYSDRIAKGTDISTGIRKAVKRLNIPNCGNTNNLNQLYRECLTSSTPD